MEDLTVPKPSLSVVLAPEHVRAPILSEPPPAKLLLGHPPGLANLISRHVMRSEVGGNDHSGVPPAAYRTEIGHHHVGRPPHALTIESLVLRRVGGQPGLIGTSLAPLSSPT